MRLVDSDGTTTIADVSELVLAERRQHAEPRPWVYCNMVTSVDGAATADGRSAGLSRDADRAVFRALRASADVIVAGAATVREEDYRLPRPLPTAVAERRRAEGRGDRPRLCIVTRSGDLGTARLLGELPDAADAAAPWQRPIVATTDATAATWDDARFDVLALGPDDVDPHRLVAAMADAGLHRVLCEGGPVLLAQLAAAGVVDEWNFTISPMVTAGDAPRVLHGPAAAVPLELDRMIVDDDSTVLARYLTRHAPSPPPG